MCSTCDTTVASEEWILILSLQLPKNNGNFKITRNNKNFNLDVQKDVEGSCEEIGTCRRREMTNIEVHGTL